MNTRPSSWMTQENIALMQVLWEQGLTATEIANKIGERGYFVTRNAIIGKTHRLGLCHNVANKPEKARLVPKRRAAPVHIPRAIGRLPIAKRKAAFNRSVQKPKLNGFHRRGGDMAKEPDPSKQVSLIQAKEGDCRAIIGYLIDGKIKPEAPKGQLAGAICCGETAVLIESSGKMVNSPWCAYHHDRYTTEPRK